MIDQAIREAVATINQLIEVLDRFNPDRKDTHWGKQTLARDR